VPNLRLSIAISDYDHVRDLTSGLIPVEGLELTHLDLPVEEIFHRFLHHREWDVSELSFAKYAALVAAGDTSLAGIPVFPSRAFRHSSMYVRAGSGLHHPEQLRGRRVGLPEWAQTAAVYSRALMQYEYGVDLAEIEWFQAGVNDPGRREKVKVSPPEGVTCTPVPDRSLTEMLLAGDLDAVFSAHPPAAFEAGSGEVVRLIADLAEAEYDHWTRTGIFPIMHVVVLKRSVVDADPWVPMALYKGFEAAKQRSFARLEDITISRFPVPMTDLTSARHRWPADMWPYGVEPNLTTLESFLRFAFEQGVLSRKLRPEDLFVASVDGGFRV
jgi:4,5-dihydroxyphthalate decarboxylase